MNTVNLTALRSLRAEYDFLMDFMRKNPMPPDDPGLAIYLYEDHEFAFVKGARVPTTKSRTFWKEAPPAFYRGGVNGFIKTAEGLLVLSDERMSWVKPFPAGLAHLDEGEDLMLTFHREFGEEVSVFALDRSAYFVPRGSKAKFNGGEIGITLANEQPTEFGELNVLGCFVNEKERILELHVEWDISALSVPYSVILTEDWFQGGWPGIPVSVLSPETGKLVGVFAGQQGFVPIDWIHHPSVANYLGPKYYRKGNF
ncbi:MAG: hypothetical protein A3J54_02915 [Candidatus Ryanbacteria bacterium RIFCSPHIGHO2_02_FULL_45_13b]|uniref:Uncharacterized protein n=1 Tax=Candidatus Ryanbacteria bacterium RIFCSPHIGHO2_02_FULL_45_13b TaxID=1802117 RepID=A0A1G2G6W8_9BACT|nr:MAG: hypothetical protein A3J54_02915 [Candidatus Ryanbacteria bacterium RIFCSPHIGHO2_02_FULL_45_13b]